jgi:DegV family protein with EDD domain
MKISHWFTVMDLDTLKRGGRVSAAAAFFAKTLNIHPVLHVSNEGKLVARMKKIGRKNALNTIAEKLFETYIPDENEVICISYSCCLEDATKLKDAIIHKTGIKNIILNEIGPVIGGHCGIGTIAVFFVSKER